MPETVSQTDSAGAPFDPDAYRMSIGDHLEELRRRLILGLSGFALTLAVSLYFGNQVIAIFCKPYVDTLLKKNLSPQFFYTELGEGFSVYVQISLIVATALAAPWLLYQLWLFVAAGLYEHERKWVTKYAPLSVFLLVGGMAFVYFLVLPWTVDFFIDWGSSIPLPEAAHVTVNVPATQRAELPPPIPSFKGDPDPWPDHTLWMNTLEGRLKLKMDGHTRVVPFGPENLASPHITLANYIDLVVGMLVTFGLSFQLPLVVVALVRIGILRMENLKTARRYVYFGMAILAAVITPGDVITSTVALMVPLCLLFELGVFLARSGGAVREESA